MNEIDSPGGTYTLVVSVSTPVEISVGALGGTRFAPGEYAYTGSALGSGGFSRVDRHHRVAAGGHDVTHWHIDYLLADNQTVLTDTVGREMADIECAVAQKLPESPVHGFGVSDCSCLSHLAYANDGNLVDTVTGIYSRFDEGHYLSGLGNRR